MIVEYRKTFGMPEIITILFIIGKIFGYLEWSWWLVFLPLIIVYGLGLLIWLIIFIINYIRWKKQDYMQENLIQCTLEI